MSIFKRQGSQNPFKKPPPTNENQNETSNLNSSAPQPSLKLKFDQLMIKYEEKKLEQSSLQFKLTEMESLKNQFQQENMEMKCFISDLKQNFRLVQQQVYSNSYDQLERVFQKIQGDFTAVEKISLATSNVLQNQSFAKERERVKDLEDEIKVYLQSLKQLKQENNSLRAQLGNNGKAQETALTQEGKKMARKRGESVPKKEKQMATDIRNLFTERQNLKDKIRGRSSSRHAAKQGHSNIQEDKENSDCLFTSNQKQKNQKDQFQEKDRLSSQINQISPIQEGSMRKSVLLTPPMRDADDFNNLINQLSAQTNLQNPQGKRFPQFHNQNSLPQQFEDQNNQNQIRLQRIQKRLQQKLQSTADEIEVEVVGILQLISEASAYSQIKSGHKQDNNFSILNDSSLFVDQNKKENQVSQIRKSCQEILSYLENFGKILSHNFDHLDNQLLPSLEEDRIKLKQQIKALQGKTKSCEEWKSSNKLKIATQYQTILQQEDGLKRQEEEIEDLKSQLDQVKSSLQNMAQIYSDNEQQLRKEIQKQAQNGDEIDEQNRYKIQQLQEQLGKISKDKVYLEEQIKVESSSYQMKIRHLTEEKERLLGQFHNLQNNIVESDKLEKENSSIYLRELRRQIDQQSEVINSLKEEFSEINYKLQQREETLKDVVHDKDLLLRENESVKGQALKQEQQIEQLEELLNTKLEENQELQSQNSLFSSQFQVQTKDLEFAKIQCEERRRELESLKHDYQKLLHEKEDLRVHLSKFEDQISSLRSEREHQQADADKNINEQANRNQQLVKQVQDLREKQKDLESEIQKQKMQLDSKDNEINWVTVMIEKEKEKFASEEVKYKQLIEFKFKQCEQDGIVQIETKKLEFANSQLQTTIDQQKETISQLTQLNGCQKEQIRGLQTDLKEVEKQFQLLNMEHNICAYEKEAIEKLNQNLNSSVSHLKSTENESFKKITELQKEIQTLQMQKQVLEIGVKDLNRQLHLASEQQKQTKEKYEAQIQFEKQQFKSLETQSKQMIQQKENELSERLNYVKVLDEELSVLKQQVDQSKMDQRKRVDLKRAEFDKIVGQNEGLKGKLVDLQEQSLLIQEELFQKIDAQKNQLAKLKQSLKSLKHENQSLKQELNKLDQLAQFSLKEKDQILKELQFSEEQKILEKESFRKDLSELKEKIIELNSQVEESYLIKEREIQRAIQKGELRVEQERQKWQQSQIREKDGERDALTAGICEVLQAGKQMQFIQEELVKSQAQLKSLQVQAQKIVQSGTTKYSTIQLNEDVVLSQKIDSIFILLGTTPLKQSYSLEQKIDALLSLLTLKHQDEQKFQKQLIDTSEELELSLQSLEPLLKKISSQLEEQLSEDARLQILDLLLKYVKNRIKQINQEDYSLILAEQQDLLHYSINQIKGSSQTNHFKEIGLLSQYLTWEQSQSSDQKQPSSDLFKKVIEMALDSHSSYHKLSKKFISSQQDYSDSLSELKINKESQEALFAHQISIAKQEIEASQTQSSMLEKQLQDSKSLIHKFMSHQQPPLQNHSSLSLLSPIGNEKHYQSERVLPMSQCQLVPKYLEYSDRSEVREEEMRMGRSNGNDKTDVQRHFREREKEFLKMIEMNQKEIQRLKQQNQRN